MEKGRNLIDIYIEQFPTEVQVKLLELRKAILDSAPEAEETISYQMPTFKLNGNLVHFAGYSKHIGFYPSPSGLTNFKEELEQYKTSKGAIQLPLDKPIPVELIRKIVSYRVKENLTKK